jgi:hypothetical protein
VKWKTLKVWQLSLNQSTETVAFSLNYQFGLRLSVEGTYTSSTVERACKKDQIESAVHWHCGGAASPVSQVIDDKRRVVP